MSKIAVKFFKIASLGLGSLSLALLASPWILSNPTCLKFACSLLSAKLHKTIECSKFSWQPFEKAELSSLKVSGGDSLQFEVKQIVIENPLSVLFDYLKGHSTMEVFSHHLVIDDVSLFWDGSKVAELISHPSEEENQDGKDFTLFLLTQNLGSVIADTLGQSELPILYTKEALPDRFEIPFRLRQTQEVIDLQFTSAELQGNLSFWMQDQTLIKGHWISSLLSEYELDLAATFGKNKEFKAFDSSIRSAKSENNSLQISINAEDAKAKFRLFHLSQLAKQLGFSCPMIPQHVNLETTLSFQGKRPFALDIVSDLGEGHFIGHQEIQEWILEKGDFALNLQNAKPLLPSSLKDDIGLIALSGHIENATLSKENRIQRLEGLSLKVEAAFPKLQIEEGDIQLFASCEDDQWNLSVHSIFSKDPILFSIKEEGASLMISLQKEVEIASPLFAALHEYVDFDHLTLNSASCKVPLNEISHSEIKTSWIASGVKVKTKCCDVEIGPLEASISNLGSLKNWKGDLQNEEDLFAFSYKTSGDEISTSTRVSKGVLEVTDLPFGKWVHPSLLPFAAEFDPDFKISGVIDHSSTKEAIAQNNSTQKIRFALNGNSNEDRFQCEGEVGPSQVSIEKILYENNAETPAKTHRKIELEHFSYNAEKKELFLKNFSIEDLVEGKPLLSGYARSLDTGFLDIDFHVLNKEGQTKFSFNALLNPFFSLKEIPLQKVEIESDHLLLSPLIERKVPLAKELKDLLGEEWTCSFKLQNGDLKSRFRSNKWMVSTSGHFDEESFVLNKPFFAQIGLDSEALLQLNQWFPEAKLTSYQFMYPLNIRVQEDFFKIPLSSNWKEIRAKGCIELAQFHAPRPPFASSLFKILKQKDTHDVLNFWATPIDFQIEHGKLHVGRVDLLVEHTFHFALWGNGDFNTNSMNFHLGLAQDTLKSLFGLQELPHDFLLSLPLQYKNEKIDIDFKESLKTIEQFLFLKGAVSGALPSWMDQFLQLGKYSALPYPPLLHKLPWQVVSEEQIRKKTKNKIKPKKEQQETPKTKESDSTAEKAKEWVELFKIFKVLS